MDSLTALTLGEELLRLSLALVTGTVIGLERESHGRAAGLRTTILVCVAAAVAMIVSQSLFEQAATGATGYRPDPARLAAGILSGMGFLGAGAIIREGNVVRGVTTAAVLWFVTILGLAFGSGHITLGLLGFVVALLVLFGLPKLESLVQSDWYGALTVTTAMDGLSEHELKRRIETAGVTVKRMCLNYDLQHQQRRIRCELKYKRGCLVELPQRLVSELARCPAVVNVTWA